MSVFELCEIAGLKLSPSGSSNTFTLALGFAYCSSTFDLCALNSVVCLSPGNRISVSSSAILSFSFSALPLFDDAFECLLDLFDDTLPDNLTVLNLLPWQHPFSSQHL